MVLREKRLGADGAPGPVVAVTTTNGMTYLTFGCPVRLPGITLDAGTYVFERVDGRVDLVQILNKERTLLYLQAYTRPISRPLEMRDECAVVFEEPRTSVAPAIDAWYPSGMAHGHKFIYHEGR